VSTELWASWWERPWALALLAVPVVLILLALRHRARHVVATSDLEVWRASEARGAASRPRLPTRASVALVLALLALVCAAMAIAGPRGNASRVQWTCVLDTSASMSLVDGDVTRGARAIDSALQLAERQGAELRWIAPAFRVESFDRAARAWPPDGIARPTSFAAWDVPGALWITDAIPANRPRFAGFSASGGAAVPGPVAVVGADRIDWDGAQLVRRVGAAPRRFIEVAGASLDPPREPIERVLDAWISARGLELAPPGLDAQLDIVLRVRVGNAAGPEFVAGRDGWRASGRALGGARTAELESAGLLEPWISADGEALVASAPGLVVVGWSPGEPDDPAAFAVSWARLFDACVTSPRGVVPLDERVAAGAAAAEPPTDPARGDALNATWILGALAALLALGALLARRA